MSLLREYIKELLVRESSMDVVELGIRIKVKTSIPNGPNLEDIYTKIRGVHNVITVRQEGRKTDLPNGYTTSNIFVTFEDVVDSDVFTMKKEILDIFGVYSVVVKNYQGRRWSDIKGDYTVGTSATQRGDAE